jgi:hypothetical protein
MQFVMKNIGNMARQSDLVLGVMRKLGSHPSAAKRLIRRCPMCKEAMGIFIADPVKNIRPVHGFCMRCGYGFRWAIITS